MAGLGEGKDEILQVMDDLRAADVDFLTIGQYLQPTVKHHAIDRFVTPDEFDAYRNAAYGKGFLMVSSSPLTRSSYHADSDFAEMRAAREAKLADVSQTTSECQPIHEVQPHTADQLYDLVSDVENYPDFLPWCVGLRANGAR